MTAGSGLIHAEVSPPSFKQAGGGVEILQLWVNLPSDLKMTAPRYTGVQVDEIPAIPIAEGLGTLKLISGSFDSVVGPIPSLTGVFMSTVWLSAGGRVKLPAPKQRNAFLYIVSGDVTVSGMAAKTWDLVKMQDDGDNISIEAISDAVLLFGHADTINEPVVLHGPFVMNTREEISEAIRDYQAGKFDGTSPLLNAGQ